MFYIPDAGGSVSIWHRLRHKARQTQTGLKTSEREADAHLANLQMHMSYVDGIASNGLGQDSA